MKQIIITFTLMLATTSAFAQLSPDQMRAEMAKPDGHKMCPSNNEYSTTSLMKTCGGDDYGYPCHGLRGDAAFEACDKVYWDCFHRWVEDTKIIYAYNTWVRECSKPQKDKPVSLPPPEIKQTLAPTPVEVPDAEQEARERKELAIEARERKEREVDIPEVAPAKEIQKAAVTMTRILPCEKRPDCLVALKRKRERSRVQGLAKQRQQQVAPSPRSDSGDGGSFCRDGRIGC
jgi:hypothetical protein